VGDSYIIYIYILYKGVVSSVLCECGTWSLILRKERTQNEDV
jgi:hypothetical protein